MFVILIFLVVIVIFIFLNLRSKKIIRESSPKIRKISEVQNSSYQGQLKARDKDISTKTINKTINPKNNGYLSGPIEKYYLTLPLESNSKGKDPQKKLTEAVEHKKNENWEMAFKALHEAYERMKYSEIDYGIDKFLRLPMYLHAAGKKDIAWKILNNYLRGEYPIIKGEKNLFQQVMDQLEIKDKMRVVLEREKKFTQSLLFFCEVQYLNIQNLKEISKWDFDSRETKSFHKKRLAEASSLKKITELLKPKLKKANLSGQEEKIAKLILRIFKKNINPIIGTNEVRNSVTEIIKNSLS